MSNQYLSDAATIIKMTAFFEHKVINLWNLDGRQKD